MSGLIEWNDLSDSKKQGIHSSGFIIIVPNPLPQVVPLFCAVCGLPNLSSNDKESHIKYSCCESCARRWVDLNREKWEKGWRPSADEIKQEILRRTQRVNPLPL